jgi:hypothetical protein
LQSAVFNNDTGGHLVRARLRSGRERQGRRIGTPFALFLDTVPIKPHIARELAALPPVETADDATMFRRTASEVMVAFARAMMAEHQVDPERMVKALKRIAIDFDQPVKVELIFDVIAALDTGSRNRSQLLDS